MNAVLDTSLKVSSLDIEKINKDAENAETFAVHKVEVIENDAEPLMNIQTTFESKPYLVSQHSTRNKKSKDGYSPGRNATPGGEMYEHGAVDLAGLYPQDLDALNMDIQENDLKPETVAKKQVI